MASIFSFWAPSEASNNSISGGAILLKPVDARAFALKETIGADRNQISAFAINPAALLSLQSGQVSLMHERGLTDDSFNQILVGSPFSLGAWGMGISYYNGGDFVFSDGSTVRQVNAQTDYVVALGYSFSLRSVDLGITGKYLYSELIEKEHAQAPAFDFGTAKSINMNLRAYGSVQNIGPKLKYDQHGDPLPTSLRTGLAWFLPVNPPTSLFFDLPYYLYEKKLTAAVGAELWMGPLALRGGYKSGIDLGGFSIGAGFKLGQFDLNYGFGFINDLDSQHVVSISGKFGGKSNQTTLTLRHEPNWYQSRWVATP